MDVNSVFIFTREPQCIHVTCAHFKGRLSSADGGVPIASTWGGGYVIVKTQTSTRLVRNSPSCKRRKY